jgi:hypothetical protein
MRNIEFIFALYDCPVSPIISTVSAAQTGKAVMTTESEGTSGRFELFLLWLETNRFS